MQDEERGCDGGAPCPSPLLVFCLWSYISDELMVYFFFSSADDRTGRAVGGTDGHCCRSFTMVGSANRGDVGLDAASGVFARLRPDGVLMDCMNSSPSTRR